MKKITPIILGVALIGAVGLYVLFSGSQNKNLSNVAPVAIQNTTYVNSAYGFSFILPSGWMISEELNSYFDALDKVQKSQKYDIRNLTDQKSNIEFTNDVNRTMVRWDPETAQQISLIEGTENEVNDLASSLKLDIANIDKLPLPVKVFVTTWDASVNEASSTPERIQKNVTLKNGTVGGYMKGIKSDMTSVTLLKLPLGKQDIFDAESGMLVKSVVIQVLNDQLSEQEILNFANTFQFSE